jgi:hypothetical protein
MCGPFTPIFLSLHSSVIIALVGLPFLWRQKFRRSPRLVSCFDTTNLVDRRVD